MIKIIDNVHSILRDDLAEAVHRGDKVSMQSQTQLSRPIKLMRERLYKAILSI